MNKKVLKQFLLIVMVTIVVLLTYGFKAVDTHTTLNKPTTNDNFNFISINQILMYVANNGDGSHDPSTDGSGFYWPGGRQATISAIFEDGLVWAGKIGREIRMNGNTHRQGLQAGKILADGTADNPNSSKYRVYKIKKGWELLPPGPEKTDYELDYNEWPVEDGAPWVDIDGDGVFTRGVDEPEFVGDEVLWYVANDLDEARCSNTYGSPSIGLEFQTTVFGFNRTGDLGDMVFKKYLMINKSQSTVKDMYVGYWSDTDLGNASDDATGCDTVLSLGYTYNFDNDDEDFYGANPPSVGYDFFQGAQVYTGIQNDSAKFLGKWRYGYQDLGLTGFTLYANSLASIPDPRQGEYQGSIEFYNYLSGKKHNGESFIDPITNAPANFTVPGDPTLGASGGWTQLNWPGGPGAQDMRHVMASGPFTLAPGDSQEIVIAIIIARGTSHLNSITELKRKDFAAQVAYDLDFNLTPAPEAPKMTAAAKDKMVTLWWEDNSESYDAIDPLLLGQGIDDTTYNFEGYRVWQFRDETGTDPQLLGVFDIANGISQIDGIIQVNGENVIAPIIKSPDQGLRRYLTLTQDVYRSAPFRNGTPYYFAVTAYGYSPNSDPSILENPPVIQEVRPGTQKIDQSNILNDGDYVAAQQVSGVGDGRVEFKIIDPDRLTGDEYKVVMNGADDSLSLDLINMTQNDTLLKNFTEFNDNYYFSTNLVENRQVTDETFVYENLAFSADGFLFLIQNQGKDSINLATGSEKYVLKEIVEVNGPGGSALEEPIDVIKNVNSTGNWQISSNGAQSDSRINIDWQDNVGFDTYEIRFTATGSQYYATGQALSFVPQTANDPLGKGTVPFEVWNVGQDLTSTADDFRMIIKIRDFDRPDTLISIPDSSWSQLPNNNWEEIYCYMDYNIFPDTIYQEPLPATSGRSQRQWHFLGRIVIKGEVPEEGTVIRIVPWRPLKEGDAFTAVVEAPDMNAKSLAKNRIDLISVFPNPYFGSNPLERDKYQRFVRFTNLPHTATVRIFSLAGVLIQTIEKESDEQWLDWDLRNDDGLPVASGVYIAHLEMPGIGNKIMKIAVIMETQYIDRL